jgi:hypothetical protein
MSHLLDNLPDEVSYIREYALKYGRDTEQETFNLIHEIATSRELNEIANLERLILENDHLETLIEFVRSNLESFPGEAKKLNSFVWAIMAAPGN